MVARDTSSLGIVTFLDEVLKISCCVGITQRWREHIRCVGQICCMVTYFCKTPKSVFKCKNVTTQQIWPMQQINSKFTARRSSMYLSICFVLTFFHYHLSVSNPDVVKNVPHSPKIKIVKKISLVLHQCTLTMPRSKVHYMQVHKSLVKSVHEGGWVHLLYKS